ncbi:hypothetical protein ACFL0V_03160 [Nanoarchaeota archaeon]
MSRKTQSNPKLEAYIGQEVVVHYSTPFKDACFQTPGVLNHVEFPWTVTLGTQMRGGKIQAFAGPISGIVRITSGRKTVYENREIPLPYPQFRTRDDYTEWSELNTFRRQIWDEDFAYDNDSIADVVQPASVRKT